MIKQSTILLAVLPLVLLGVTFETMNLSQEVNVQALDTANNSLCKTNNTTIIKSPDVSGDIISSVSSQNIYGIIFDVRDDGNISFNFGDTDIAGEGMERIMINGKSLLDCIDERISLAMNGTSPRAITNIVSDMVYNPLWGKKLAVIGDSLITAPSASQSYPAFIAKRNNMTIVHKGRGGERLCTDVTNELGQITNMSCIKSYTNDIPADTDYILCQIGANDATRWQMDVSEGVDDTDMSLETFKGCFNNLLIGLRKNYPNAKLGMVLANNWAYNLGQKSEDTPAS